MIKIKQNIVLAKYTTYKIGGPADYFVSVKNYDELNQALKFSEDHSLSSFVLAGGSNVLFGDDGFRGLIIKLDNKNANIHGKTITAEAGAPMSDLVNQSIEKGLAGLEWAGGLPGTFGGAIRGNAGCFGGETKDAVVEVTTMASNGELKVYSNADCCFGYRESIFKRNKETILNAVLKLKSGDSRKLKTEVFDHIKYRQAKHRMPSCGSIFKNVPVKNVPEKILGKFSQKIKVDPFPIIPAGAVIEACGLVGKTIGGARITEEHANIIHNFNNAKATDVLALINLAKEEAGKQFGIKLEEEVELII